MVQSSHITVILPIYQLAARGLGRVDRSLYSIACNSVVPPVLVMDGSQPVQFAAVEASTSRDPFVQHVVALHQYNGTTRRAFDLTLSRSEFDGAIQRMFEAE